VWGNWKLQFREKLVTNKHGEKGEKRGEHKARKETKEDNS